LVYPIFSVNAQQASYHKNCYFQSGREASVEPSFLCSQWTILTAKGYSKPKGDCSSLCVPPEVHHTQKIEADMEHQQALQITAGF